MAHDQEGAHDKTSHPYNTLGETSHTNNTLGEVTLGEKKQIEKKANGEHCVRVRLSIYA